MWKTQSLHGTGQAYGCFADIANILNLKAASRVAAFFALVRPRIDGAGAVLCGGAA